MEIIKAIFGFPARVLSYIQNHFKAMIFLLLLYFIFEPTTIPTELPNLAKIRLSGNIVSAEAILEKIDEVRKDETIKGALFIINSGGGAVAPSVEISRAIKRLNDSKPVVTYASGTLASGSYYAAINSSAIVANPGSLVGSIGVIMQGMNLAQLSQKVGVVTQTIKAGKFKEVGTTMRKWDPAEKAELKKVIDGTYNMFVRDVANARKLDVKNHTVFADAHIFTSDGALAVGLIDKVGVSYDAEELLVQISGVKHAVFKQEDKFDKLIGKLNQEVHTFVLSLTQSLQLH